MIHGTHDVYLNMSEIKAKTTFKTRTVYLKTTQCLFLL